MKLIANAEQVLSKFTSRHLLTFEKFAEPVNETELNSQHHVVDFREKYFEIREETRKERRMKKAILREQGRLEALRRNENKK